MSFADYLGLRRADVERMLADMDARRMQSEDEALEALNRARLEANARAEMGLSPSLQSTASYSDFLRLRDEAEMLARRPRTGVYQEDAVLEALRPQQQQQQRYDLYAAERRAQDMAARHAAEWQGLNEWRRADWERVRREQEARRQAEEALKAKRREEASKRNQTRYVRAWTV
jgi:hypothetical protein